MDLFQYELEQAVIDLQAGSQASDANYAALEARVAALEAAASGASRSASTSIKTAVNQEASS